jgi:hypothetical protein
MSEMGLGHSLIPADPQMAYRERPTETGLPGWAYRTRTGESVRELPDWIRVTTSPEQAHARRRRPFACKLRNRDLQLRPRFQQTILARKSGIASRGSRRIRHGQASPAPPRPRADGRKYDGPCGRGEAPLAPPPPPSRILTAPGCPATILGMGILRDAILSVVISVAGRHRRVARMGLVRPGPPVAGQMNAVVVRRSR